MDLSTKIPSFILSNVGYLLGFVAFVLFIVTKSALFSILVVFSLLLQLFLEVREDVKQKGWTRELIEVLAVAIGIFLIFKIIGYFLNTDTPISVIASCSMAPHFSAGDVVIIQNKIPDDIPKITLSYAEIKELNDSVRLFDRRENKSYELKYSAKTECLEGCYCSGCDSLCRREPAVCREFLKRPEDFEEHRGPLSFTFSRCRRKNGGIEICSNQVKYGDMVYSPKNESPVVAYSASQQEFFSFVPGDIIHRLVLAVKGEDGEYYFILKGDNNDVFDIQIGSIKSGRKNILLDMARVKGVELFKIPYIGYLKLFLSGYIVYQTECDNYFI